MTQQPPGPGWWQASDGNWYPPEAAGTQTPPSTPTAPTQPVAGPADTPGGPTPPTAPSGATPPGVPAGPGGPSPTPPAAPGSKAGKWIGVGLVLAVLVVGGVFAAVALTSGDKDKKVATTATTRPTSTTVPDDGELKIIGAEGAQAINRLISAAITDIEAFWAKEYPKVFDDEYEPVRGGFYSASPEEELPPCATAATDIAGNAYYCGDEDVMAWDDTDLMPRLKETYGDLAVVVVMAHEFGHAVQARANMEGATVTLEHQADCYAGAYVGDLADRDDPPFDVTPVTIDKALAGFLELGDTPGTAATDPNAHGSAFDRVNGFQDGIENGAASCAKYRDDNITIVQLPFTDQEDLDRGGNLPVDELLPALVADLDDFWTQVFSQEGGTWTPVTAVPFDGTGPPCGTDDTSGYLLFYCAADNSVAFDNATMQQIGTTIGDFAVGVLIATQYGLAAQVQAGVLPDDPKEQNVNADCLAGAYAASVLVGDRPETGYLALSPGDLDEAVQALLTFSSTQSEENSDQGIGFERVRAFRTGVLDGYNACGA